MFRVVFANILLFWFLLTEFLLRKKGESKSLKTQKSDKGSTGIIGIAYSISIIMLIIVSFTECGFFYSQITGYAGLLLMLIGLILRIWSMIILGDYYSRTLHCKQSENYFKWSLSYYQASWLFK